MDISKISVNAQNSIRIDAGKIIFFDPFNINEISSDADYIFITHDHYDHFSPEDINKIVQSGTKFIIPAAMEKKFRKSFGKASSMMVTPRNKYQTEDFPFETVQDSVHLWTIPSK
jgi:Predicted Zn-dependent hydrolases of the beta-lactamase fold